MQYRNLVIVALAVVAACDKDPTGPAAGMFTANVTGARTLQLAGMSFTGLVYTEARPQGSYTITMSNPVGMQTRLVLIDCPDTQFFQVRTYTLTADENACYGYYRLIDMGAGGPAIVEQFISITGTLTVKEVTTTAVKGSFQFTGDLSPDGQSNAPVTAAGVFNSARFQ
jgi:hypothetical protein